MSQNRQKTENEPFFFLLCFSLAKTLKTTKMLKKKTSKKQRKNTTLWQMRRTKSLQNHRKNQMFRFGHKDTYEKNRETQKSLKMPRSKFAEKSQKLNTLKLIPTVWLEA